MARLHIVTGYDGHGAGANPSLVYLGRDGDAAQAAMAADTTHIRYEWIRNPQVIRKANDIHPSIAEAKAKETAASIARSEAEEKARLEAEAKAKADQLAEARALIAEAESTEAPGEVAAQPSHAKSRKR